MVVTGASEWPRDTPILTSPNVAFLEKAAMWLNENENNTEDFCFAVKDGAVQFLKRGLETAEWIGVGEDDLWSNCNNWEGVLQGVKPNMAVVVSAGGLSVNDLGRLPLYSFTFAKNISEHDVAASSESDELSLSAYIRNESSVKQKFSLPVAIDAELMKLHTVGDIEFSQGLKGKNDIELIKTGAGALIVNGGLSGVNVKLSEGALDLCGKGEALFVQEDGAEPVIASGTALRNGIYTYQNVKKGYLPWSTGNVVVDNASLTTPKLFKAGGDRIKDCERRQLVITNNASVIVTQTPAYIISRDNGDGLDVSGNESTTTPVEVKVLDNSLLKLIADQSQLYIGMFNASTAARNGRLDVVDSSVFGYDLKIGHRAGRSWLYVTNSVVSFSSSIQLCPDADNAVFDTNGIEVRFSNSIVTTSVFRVYSTHLTNKSEPKHFCYFDNVTLVSNGDREMFLEKKDGHDKGLIFIEDGGLKVVAPVDKLTKINANANIEGTGGLTKLGEGILELASTNTYAGTTRVSEGTLRLTGRVAGAIEVASGASLELAISAEGEEVPYVPNLVMEEGSSLKAVSPGLPEGVARVDVLRSYGEILVPAGVRDASGNIFYVSSTSVGNVLRYGRKPGFAVLVR